MATALHFSCSAPAPFHTISPSQLSPRHEKSHLPRFRGRGRAKKSNKLLIRERRLNLGAKVGRKKRNIKCFPTGSIHIHTDENVRSAFSLRRARENIMKFWCRAAASYLHRGADSFLMSALHDVIHHLAGYFAAKFAVSQMLTADRQVSSH